MDSTLERTPASTPTTESEIGLGRVLVVDDSIVNQRLSTALLKQRGYQVDVAGNGQEAVRLLCEEAREYDVVLMDCHMPEMDGFQATAIIRSHPGPNQRTTVIALTGSLQETQVFRCNDSGMDDYLGKPIRVDEFEATLKRCQAAKSPPPAPQPTGTTIDTREPFWDHERIAKLRTTMDEEADEFLGEMIGMFLAEAPGLIESLQTAVEANHAQALQEAAHRFKGSSRNLGLIRIADVCLKLEQMGKQAELSAAMYWFKRLKSLTNQVAERARNEQGIKVPE
jgi:two-component system, sensor histidine kinase and response regulator